MELPVFEEFVLSGNLLMVLEMVHHLPEVVRKAFEVDRAGDRSPSEVVMRLLIVAHLYPEVGACPGHDAFDERCIVASEDLVLEEAATLRLR